MLFVSFYSKSICVNAIFTVKYSIQMCMYLVHETRLGRHLKSNKIFYLELPHLEFIQGSRFVYSSHNKLYRV